ncbi:hypothetical protein NAPIS_ORF02238 [Vairimorpha apis BRL 01]|uniref:Uncharacterized protein n=1 Tax=Vairimorpha apis BRL 01 TaxID=1037528 RepID=T0KXT8_9MICR|nr:hypothetical protein NAPIS_ORF02238 [Vairimorpha apis BRL 01]
MQKNKNNYNIEPSKNKCSSTQISHTEFEDYLKHFFKKPDETTYDVLNCSEIYVKKRNEDLLYQVLIGEEDDDTETDNRYNLYKKQVYINNLRKLRLIEIIKRKAKYNLEFDLIRDIDNEIENCILKRNKKKRKGDFDAVLGKLVQRRENLEQMINEDKNLEDDKIDEEFIKEDNVMKLDLDLT